MTNVVRKKAVNPDTDAYYLIDLPAPEVVRQAILELEYPSDGIRVFLGERLCRKTHPNSQEGRGLPQ